MIYTCKPCGRRIFVTEKGPPGYTMNDQRRELPGLCPACALATLERWQTNLSALVGGNPEAVWPLVKGPEPT